MAKCCPSRWLQSKFPIWNSFLKSFKTRTNAKAQARVSFETTAVLLSLHDISNSPTSIRTASPSTSLPVWHDRNFLGSPRPFCPAPNLSRTIVPRALKSALRRPCLPPEETRPPAAASYGRGGVRTPRTFRPENGKPAERRRFRFYSIFTWRMNNCKEMFPTSPSLVSHSPARAILPG